MRILIIAGVNLEFGGGGHRPAHLYRTFKRLDYEVKYFFPAYQQFDFNEDLYDLVIIEYPYKQLAKIIPRIKDKVKIIYEVLDDWKELFSPIYDFSSESIIIENSDLVTAVSKELCRKYDAFYSPNAVDLDLVTSIKGLNKKLSGNPDSFKIGYVGHIENHWFDWQTIKAIANIPTFSIHLVGRCRTPQFKADNLFFYGEKSYDEIPEYINSFDVGIIPFKTGKLFDGVSPLKAYEYLAGKKPVISYTTKEIISSSNVNYVKDITDFMTCLLYYYELSKKGNLFVEDLDISQEDWIVRAEDLLRQINLIKPIYF
jgi:hypothetical protein